MTRCNQLDIKIATGGKKKKKYRVFFCTFFEQIWHPWRTQYHACNNQFIMSNHFTADNGMRTGFNRSFCMAWCSPRLPNLFKVQTKLLFELPRSSFVVSSLAVRVPHHRSRIHVLLMMRFKWGTTNY